MRFNPTNGRFQPRVLGLTRVFPPGQGRRTNNGLEISLVKVVTREEEFFFGTSVSGYMTRLLPKEKAEVELKWLDSKWWEVESLWDARSLEHALERREHLEQTMEALMTVFCRGLRPISDPDLPSDVQVFHSERLGEGPSCTVMINERIHILPGAYEGLASQIEMLAAVGWMP